MQPTKTIFSDSAIFVEKKTVENQLWTKKLLQIVDFCGQKILIIPSAPDTFMTQVFYNIAAALRPSDQSSCR